MALGLSFGGLTGVAVADPPRTHECLSNVFPDSDLNERYGVSERIIGPPATPTTPGCRQAFAGEKWVRAVPPWSTAGSAEAAAYPSDYVPDLPNPRDDFMAKFVSVHYVNDRGTAQEKTFTAGTEVLRTAGPDGVEFASPSGLPFAALVSPVFGPLSIGAHTNTVFVTMSERHCNGLPPGRPSPRAGGEGADCLPAGESQYSLDDTPFEFLPQSD
jgi:hypothetical protein